MISKQRDAPANWEWVTLETIADINPKLPYELEDEVDVSFIPMKRVEKETGRVDLSESRKYGNVKKGYTKFINNDIIFAKITPCMENGKVAILKGLENGVGFGSTEFHVIRMKDESLSRKLYFYFLLQKGFRNLAAQNFTGTVGQRRVPTDFMKGVLVPLPPLAEQVRIVGRVEEFFSWLDVGVRSLQAAQTQLEQYRQTTLKQAYTGKYPYVNLGEIISPSKERFDPIKGQNTAYIGLADIDQHTGKILNKGTSSDTKSTKSVFHKGDLLYGRLRPYLNKVAVPDFDGVCSTDILVFPQKEQFNSNYLQQILLSHDFVDYATKNMSGVQHPRIKYDEIAKYKIPFPNICIQNQIANKIIVVFSRIYKIIQILDNINIQSDKLKQSILKMAFEGRLVAQNPNDEPANVLLERIKNEKVN